jgi:predicted lipid-binding transport protein (Tim44 family)
MRHRALTGAVALAMLALAAADAGEAWARARGGGSRGHRTPAAPARPTPATPAAPRETVTRPLPAPAPPRPAAPFGGLLGGVTGFLAGGLVGGLLFGGLAQGPGIGMLDLLLTAGGGLLLVSWLRRRRESPGPAGAMAGRGGHGAAVRAPEPAPPDREPPGEEADLARGVRHLRQMDAGFDPAALGPLARAMFADVQRALGARDFAPLRDRLTPEMFAVLQRQRDQLRAAGRTNHVEAIEVARAEVSEAWQESGRDYVTVYLTGSVLDWISDDRTGAVVEGTPAIRQAFEEFWTFTRPVGPHHWKLTAIQTG